MEKLYAGVSGLSLPFQSVNHKAGQCAATVLGVDERGDVKPCKDL